MPVVPTGTGTATGTGTGTGTGTSTTTTVTQTTLTLPNVGGTYEGLPLSVLMPARGSSEKVFDSLQVAAQGQAQVDVSGGSGYSALALTVRVTYDPSAATATEVYWLYSPDGQNFDDTASAEAVGNYQALPLSAGKTVQTTLIVPLLEGNVRILINNPDAVAITVSAWITPLR